MGLVRQIKHALVGFPVLWGLLSAVVPLVGAQPPAANAPPQASKASGKTKKTPLWLPVRFHVAQAQQHPIVTPAFLKAQLEAANRIFAPYGVQFVQDQVRWGHDLVQVRTRADRDRFAPKVEARVINCFVVGGLMDVDEPGRVRRGVHWTARSVADRHYIILSSIAQPGVLAHELGHFLGNRAHSQTPGNLMSYEWGTGQPVLTAVQQKRMQQRIRRYLRTRELVEVPARLAQP